MDILLVAEYALAEIGKYDVLICEGGLEGLAKIEEFNPDLIILDVMMPEIDGPQTLVKIREMKLLKTTPAIFITAKIFPAEVAELKSFDANVIDVIPKPFDPISISKTIRSTWESWFSQDTKNNEAGKI